MREWGDDGPIGRSPPSTFKLEGGGFIDEKNFSLHCKICGTTLAGRNESGKHLRSDHFESYQSFLQRNIFFKQGIIRYKEWEDQETLIEGLTVLQPEWERNTTQEQKR